MLEQLVEQDDVEPRILELKPLGLDVASDDLKSQIADRPGEPLGCDVDAGDRIAEVCQRRSQKERDGPELQDRGVFVAVLAGELEIEGDPALLGFHIVLEPGRNALAIAGNVLGTGFDDGEFLRRRVERFARTSHLGPRILSRPNVERRGKHDNAPR